MSSSFQSPVALWGGPYLFTEKKRNFQLPSRHPSSWHRNENWRLTSLLLTELIRPCHHWTEEQSVMKAPLGILWHQPPGERPREGSPVAGYGRNPRGRYVLSWYCGWSRHGILWVWNVPIGLWCLNIWCSNDAVSESCRTLRRWA